MPTTSSPTSARLSTGSNLRAAVTWSVAATILIALGFAGTSSGETDPDLLYQYEFAVGSVFVYGILVGVTIAIATWLGRPLPALGLKGFAWRWLWIAIGLIFLVLILAQLLEPVLHAGEKQGFAPEDWRPDRAGAFALNVTVAATLVPFAEELFFRGLGVPALLPLGSIAAVLLSAVAFGLGHGLVSALPILVPFGLALGWVRLRSGSVWPGVLAHGFYNGAALVYLYFDLTQGAMP
jgi:membrane protease YdiL (CAAX protease family)